MGEWLPTPIDNVGMPQCNTPELIQPAATLWLPPRELWLIDPDKEKIPTPVDDRGIVDIPKTIEAVRQQVDPSYEFPAIFLGEHHFHWAGNKYSREPSTKWGIVPAQFRDLPPLKGDIGRVLENFLHLITEEPPVPSEEVMYHYSEAWRVAKNLFACARAGLKNEHLAKRQARRVELGLDVFPKDPNRENRVGKEYFGSIKSKIEQNRDKYLAELERVPPEFRLVSPNTSPKKVAERVGRLAMRGSHKLRRFVNEAA
jgi:hypothetical protein